MYESTSALGTDLCIGATASASNQLTGFEANQANDNDPTFTRWDSGVIIQPTWWAVDFGTDKAVRSFYIYDANGGGYIAKSIAVQYSSNGSSWTTLKIVNTTQPTSTATAHFTASNVQ